MTRHVSPSAAGRTAQFADYFDERPFAADLNVHEIADDFERAFVTAALFWGRYRRKILRRLDRLAIEATKLISNEQVWSMITRVAVELLGREGHVLLGDEINEICRPELSTCQSARHLKEIQGKLARQ